MQNHSNPRKGGTILQNRLMDLLTYDEQTGVFTWRKKYCSKVMVGKAAGSLDVKGYLRIRIDRKLYAAHHLAWLYVYGTWPSPEIDHINRVRHDNRIANLRISKPGPQQLNTKMFSHNTSGIKGVGWHKPSKRWRAYIQIEGKYIHLGWFKTISEAASARQAAEQSYQQSNDGRDT